MEAQPTFRRWAAIASLIALAGCGEPEPLQVRRDAALYFVSRQPCAGCIEAVAPDAGRILLRPRPLVAGSEITEVGCVLDSQSGTLAVSAMFREDVHARIERDSAANVGGSVAWRAMDQVLMVAPLTGAISNGVMLNGLMRDECEGIVQALTREDPR